MSQTSIYTSDVLANVAYNIPYYVENRHKQFITLWIWFSSGQNFFDISKQIFQTFRFFQGVVTPPTLRIGAYARECLL